MTRRSSARLCAGLALLLASGSWGQSSTAFSPEQVEAERARIASERANIAARFAVEEKACHQRFAVTDCLTRNLAWQRDALAALRRQEVLLNDSERHRRAAERLDSLDEKSREHEATRSTPPAAEPRSPHAAPRPGGGKLPQAGEPVPRVPDQAAIEAHQQRMDRKQQRHDEVEAQRAGKAAQADDEARRNAARVQQAEERKARIQERNAAEPSKARPLPSPAP